MGKPSTPEDDLLSVMAREMGRRGGPARARALSPERRREIARKASQTRWRKAKKPKKVA